MDTPNTFVDPKTVIRQLGLVSGNIVADFGCGAGYFSVESARVVGESGCVYAIDVLPSALESIESQAKTGGLRNIVVKRANLERENGSNLPPSSVDCVIAKDIFFQNKNRDVMMREISRVLRPGGRALIMEWSKEDMGVGPDVALRVSQDELKTLAGGAGFSMERDLPVGAFHYAFVMKKG
jgi:ubiquinone/menaquinone biosynthesis C-methylase UbiE